MRVERTFHPAPNAVAGARRFVCGALEEAGVGGPELHHSAALAISELATNAIEHAETSFTVVVALDDGVVRLELDDASAAMPELQPLDATSIGGGGLVLVAELCRRWGSEPRPGGKTVWCELDLR